MKNNIHFFIICLLQLSIVQLAVGQTDNNGRPLGTQPAQVDMQEAATDNTARSEVFKGHDFDEDRDYLQQDENDTYYPQDVEVLQDELFNSSSPQEVIEQVTALKRLVTELNRTTEELRRENRLIRRSLGACCSRSELGYTANDAYLLQNAPNPSQGRTQIEYFIPEGLRQAQIEVRDVKGVLIKAFDVEAEGMSQIALDASQFTAGTYLYYLTIDGAVIDSKVMIINR